MTALVSGLPGAKLGAGREADVYAWGDAAVLKPWHVLGLARALATTHLAVNRAQAPAELPDLRHVLADRIQDAVLAPHLRDLAMRVLDELPDGDRLCHGDYHPGNVLLAAGRAAVIDWAGAARGVPKPTMRARSSCCAGPIRYPACLCYPVR